MLSLHIATQIYEYFVFEPTSEQKKVIEGLAEYLTSSDSSAIFVLNGYAGTGKTTLLGALVRTLRGMGVKQVLLAPTGRAAKVLEAKAGERASTIHKHIYRERVRGEESLFELNFNRNNDTLYLIDEASMLVGASGESSQFGTGDLIDDLLTFIHQGNDNRVLFVGDGAQLPPVGYDTSPALDPRYMGRYGDVWYHTLSEVVRHEGASAILRNATAIRRSIEERRADIPRFELSAPEVTSINGYELIEEIETCYGRYGQDQTAIITRSNKRANRYNEGIRRTILDHDQEICSGDVLMVVKNNYHYAELDPSAPMSFIANGDTARVRKLFRTAERYGLRFGYAELTFPDYDDYTLECWLLLDTLASESPSLTREQSARLFMAVEADYAHIARKADRYKKVMTDEFYCALQVKFAYAVTCHKAQGGEWSAVFLDSVLLGPEPMTLDLMRWLYTAITRATERLYLVNYDPRFLPEE